MKLKYLKQIKNPRTNKYILIDIDRGLIIKTREKVFNFVEHLLTRW